MTTIKLNSVLIVLLMVFIAKISFDTALTERVTVENNNPSSASIDEVYKNHVNKR